VPRFLRDWAYDGFARIRYRVFGRYDSCPIPTPEQRARFID
jgi:predicted DCC family thiol-disulfide oxidoreductase YuxK